jgi:hypothetical protein
MTALSVNYTSPNGPYAAQYGAVTTAINQAFNAWMSHFDAPAGAVTINVTILPLGGNEVASAGPSGVVPVGVSGSKTINISGFAAEIATGAALSAATRSGALNIDSSWLNYYFANPATNTVEIQRVMQHEIGHMLGVIGYTGSGTTGPIRSSSYTTAFDNYLQFVGTAEYFGGPNAIAAYGGAVRMDYPSIDHPYVPGGASLMSYLDEATTIQPLDTAILRDTGLPILSTQEVAEHQVTRLYLAALGRAPDAAGLLANSRALLSGTSLSTDSAAFIASGEFARLYGTNQSNAAFVNTLYQNVLHGTGDSGGLQTWNNALAGSLSRAEVLVDFSESAENRSTLETTSNQTYSETAEAQAERLYDAAFGRAPDAVGYGNLTRAMLNGVTLQQAALGFLQSGEFANRYGAAASNGTYVDALYQNALHRAADAPGRATYLAALNSGVSRADLLVSFSESAEHVANVIKQDTPTPGAFLTDTNAHLGSIPTVPSALFG